MRLSSRLRIGIVLTGASMAGGSLFAQASTAPGKDAQVSEARGMPPRTAPADYQIQGQAGTVTIAAEFMGHAVPTPDALYSSEEYVVVETAFFGTPDARLKLTANDFSLRINGKKTLAPSVPSELVLKSLKDPSWEPPVPAEPKSKSSFGSKGGEDNTPPPPPKMPMELRHVMSQRVQRSALLEGDRALPQAGLLFFLYRGKTESIHALELVYSGAAGPATLKLQP